HLRAGKGVMCVAERDRRFDGHQIAPCCHHGMTGWYLRQAFCATCLGQGARKRTSRAVVARARGQRAKAREISETRKLPERRNRKAVRPVCFTLRIKNITII